MATIAEVGRRAGVSTSTVSHVLDRTRRVEPAGAALVERAVRAVGLRVPGDLALAAFDDFEWADCFGPRLTTVAQPVREIGRLVASPRESCGCPGRG